MNMNSLIQLPQICFDQPGAAGRGAQARVAAGGRGGLQGLRRGRGGQQFLQALGGIRRAQALARR